MATEERVTGPAGSPRRLRMPEDQPLSRGAVAALSGVLEYAATTAAKARQDPELAVHEYRKSLRRARALLRMLRPVMSKSSRRSIDRRLKEAHRAASPLRDADVLLASAERYRLAKTDGEAAAKLCDSLKARRAQRLKRHRAADVLRAGVESVRPLPQELERALPEKLRQRDLFRGLRRTYRRSREELARIERVPDETHIHNWRKRTKDLVYQLELLVSLGGAEIKALRKRYSDLTSALGEVTDLLILRRTIRENSDLRELPGKEKLEAHVSKLLHERLDSALGMGAKLYKPKPKKLTKKVARATSDRTESSA